MEFKKAVMLLIFISLFSFSVYALPSVSNFTEILQDTGEGLGQHTRMDGDINGDGVNDLVLAQHLWSTDNGRVLIYFGGATLNSSVDVILYAESNNNRFGDGMAVGDFNNDSIDDLAVGGVEYGSYTGKVYLFFGRSVWNETNNATSANVTVVGEKKSGNCGNKLSMGDVNNDSFDDLLIGCEKYDGAITNEGRAYLFFGNTNGNVDHNVTEANITFNNDLSTSTALGADVYVGGDIAGNSYVDILLSADDWLDDGDDGVALVFTGASSLSGTYNSSQANLSIYGNESFNSFGYAILSGDLNNDSRSDLILGADHFGSASGLGKLSVFYGSDSLLGDFNASEANVTITGEDDFDLFSMTIAVGDVNNDSVDDVVTSAYFYTTPWVGPGRLYVFFGGPSFDNKTLASEAEYIIDNPSNHTNSALSWWVGIGDINNDSWDEFCGVSKFNDSTSKAYIFSVKGYRYPRIEFVNPTLDNSSGVRDKSFVVNFSMTEYNLDTFIFNWNNTNYSFYDKSLILGLNFNNNSGIKENHTYFVDLSEHNNNGSCSGSICPLLNASGKFGNAYTFDGEDDYLDIGDGSLDFVQGNFSVSIWFKANDFDNNNSLYGKQDQYFLHSIGSNNTRFDIKNSSGVWEYVDFGPINLGEWHNIISVVNDTNLAIYLDGVYKNKTTYGDIDTTNNNLVIGAYNASDGFFNGTIDELRIYNRSLTNNEITKFYQSEFIKYNSSNWIFYVNLTNTISGNHTYFGWLNDSIGEYNKTQTRLLNFYKSIPVSPTTTGGSSGRSYGEVDEEIVKEEIIEKPKIIVKEEIIEKPVEEEVKKFDKRVIIIVLVFGGLLLLHPKILQYFSKLFKKR